MRTPGLTKAVPSSVSEDAKPSRKALRQARPFRALRSRTARVLLVVALVLVALRIAAPSVIQRIVNGRLAQIPEYQGSIGDVDLQLWRGTAVVENVEIIKQTGLVRAPFCAANRIEATIAWRELLRGRLVSDVHIEQGRLVLSRGPTRETSQLDVDRRWQEVVEDLAPIKITRLVLEDGELRYVDAQHEPPVDVAVEKVQLEVTGLRNRRSESPDEMPAKGTASGTTVGNGRLLMNFSADPLAELPHFDVDLQLEDMALPELNAALRAYANIDVSSGLFDLYLEAAGRDGRFEGYVKPFFEDLNFKNLSDRDRSLPSRIWESIVSAMESVLKNKPRDQLGTRVPFAGEFQETNVGTWTALVNTMRHGFVQAFSQALEGTIQPEDVATGGVDSATPAQ